MHYGVKITVSAPTVAPGTYVGAVVLVVLTEDAIRSCFPDDDTRDETTRLHHEWQVACELAKEAFCGNPKDPSRLICQFTQVFVDDLAADLKQPGAKVWPHGAATAILSTFNSFGRTNSTNRKPKDVLAKLSAISLMLVSFCLSAFALLGLSSELFHSRNEPLGESHLILIIVIASIAFLTGWMAYRISRQRLASDGRTYLGRGLIMSFAIFYTLLVVFLIVGNPKGWRFTPYILGPLLILWAARLEFSRPSGRRGVGTTEQ